MTLTDLDNIARRLEAIQKMTSNYKDYLAGYKRGGDWDVDSFMKSINKKAMEVEALVEDDQCV